MEDEAALRQVVEEQAGALTAGDLALFASYATPAALAHFYRTPAAPEAHSFDVTLVDTEHAPARSIVRLRGGATYELHAIWERTSAGWKAISMTIPGDRVTRSWWRKLLPGGKTGITPVREDLT